MQSNQLMMFSVGDRICQARKTQKLTQGGLARKAGISVVTLNRYEKGHRVPPFDVVDRIAGILECEARWILVGEVGNTDSLNNGNAEKDSKQAGRAQDLIMSEIIKILESDPEAKEHVLKLLVGRRQIIEGLTALGIAENHL